MTEQPENAMIRELSDDELLMTAGGQEMEWEAGRYTSPRAFTCRVNVLWPALRWDDNATVAQNIQGMVKGIQDYADCLGGKPIRY